MTTQPNDGGPAFPKEAYVNQHGVVIHTGTAGMSLRTYAAIKLRVPDSGIDWLDAMILQAKRDDFAGQALAGILAKGDYYTEDAAKSAYFAADAMIAARGQA